MFRQAFEAATTVSIPKQRLRELEQNTEYLRQIASAEWNAVIPQSGEYALLPGPRPTFAVPPQLTTFAPRDEILNNAELVLKSRGRVLFTGSVGSGKSTIAKILVSRISGTWMWVDLTGDSNHTFSKLWRLFSSLETDVQAKNVVLDNAELGLVDLQKYRDQIAALTALLKQRNGYLIITSQKELPRNIARSLGFNSECTSRCRNSS